MYPTLINVILDESGSMSPKRADVIGGFNLFLKEQQEKPEACRMILSKFNTLVTTVFQATPLADVKPLDEKSYTPGGNTALFDAVANMVRLADQAKQPDEKVVCLIITDGEENSSRETTEPQIKEIIKAREAQGDWTFVYLGAEPSLWQGRGVAVGNVAAYNAAAPMQSFTQTSHSTTAYRLSAEKQSKDYWNPGNDPQGGGLAGQDSH